jgi:hypothetical protein
LQASASHAIDIDASPPDWRTAVHKRRRRFFRPAGRTLGRDSNSSTSPAPSRCRDSSSGISNPTGHLRQFVAHRAAPRRRTAPASRAARHHRPVRRTGSELRDKRGRRHPATVSPATASARPARADRPPAFTLAVPEWIPRDGVLPIGQGTQVGERRIRFRTGHVVPRSRSRVPAGGPIV